MAYRGTQDDIEQQDRQQMKSLAVVRKRAQRVSLGDGEEDVR